jgi:hypothetical protein
VLSTILERIEKGNSRNFYLFTPYHINYKKTTIYSIIFANEHTIYCVLVNYFSFCQIKKTIENGEKGRETEEARPFCREMNHFPCCQSAFEISNHHSCLWGKLWEVGDFLENICKNADPFLNIPVRK